MTAMMSLLRADKDLKTGLSTCSKCSECRGEHKNGEERRRTIKSEPVLINGSSVIVMVGLAAEDETLRKYHQLNGHELKQTVGDSGGQGSPAYCSPRGCKESNTT